MKKLHFLIPVDRLIFRIEQAQIKLITGPACLQYRQLGFISMFCGDIIGLSLFLFVLLQPCNRLSFLDNRQ